MALPKEIDKTLPTDTDNPSQGAASIRDLKTFLQDVFGLTDGTDYTAAAFSITTAGVVTIAQSGLFITGYWESAEIADPAAPAATRGRVYFRSTGGKTELVARFPTGAVQQLAIEP